MFDKLSVMDDFAWRGVFDFLNTTRRNRKKLVLISEFWDRRFSSVCQKWLHEWTKNVAPLGLVDIISPPPVEPLPEVELPANIHDFTQIQFSYLDTRVLHFLRMMQPLFHDVNLVTYYGERVNTWEETRTTLDHVLPLLTNGIGCAYTTKEPLFYIRDRFPAQFFAIKQIKFRFYHWFTNTELEQLVHWLCTRRADGQPRMLRMDYLCEQALTFIERFRQLFLDATSQASFVVYKKMYYSNSEAIQESTTLNAKTNEQLVVRKRRHYPGHHLLTGPRPMHLVLVGRCPAELDADEWVEEMSWEFVGRSYWRLPPRTITLSYPKLGQIEDQKAEQEKKKMEGAEEDVDQPGPSQKK